MKQFQRWKQIVNLLQEHEYLSVDALTERLDVSIATVRRDLASLEDNQLIIRTRGGAKVQKVEIDEPPVVIKSFKRTAEKEIIGKLAASLIQDHDVVWLDAGTTTAQMIPYINAKDIFVVTNSINHILALNERGIKAFVISGTVKGTTEALIGFTTLRMIDEFNFTKCFVGANGIDVVGGFSTPQMNEGEIKRKVIQRTITPYVVADSSKFNLRSAISFAKLTDATLITDKKVKDFDYSQLKVIASED